MATYYNDKGESQSPPKTFPETMDVPYKRDVYTVPTPYLYKCGCEPIDTKRCQAASFGIASGQKPRDHPAFNLTRCDRPATSVLVVNERRFGSLDPPEGYILAYSCCDECREALTSHNPTYGKFTPIAG